MIAAPRSTKIKGGERDPEMHQVKKAITNLKNFRTRIRHLFTGLLIYRHN